MMMIMMMMMQFRGILFDRPDDFFYNKIFLIFDSSVHNRITRQMNMLHLPRIRTDFGKNSFYCNGSVIFNSLNFQCFNILFMFTVTIYKSVF